jgi:hypothetical protein
LSVTFEQASESSVRLEVQKIELSVQETIPLTETVAESVDTEAPPLNTLKEDPAPYEDNETLP